MDSPNSALTLQKSGTLMTVMEEDKGKDSTPGECVRKKSVQLSKDTLKRKDSGPKADFQKPVNVKNSLARRISMISNYSTCSRRFEPTPEPQKTLPPTYRLRPKEDEEFHWWKARPLIQDLLAVYCSDLAYNAKACAKQSTVLADMVRNKMKVLGCTRHKIVVTVDIGENKQQGVTVASRCAWDPRTDDSLHIRHTINDVYVVVGVYAIYKE